MLSRRGERGEGGGGGAVRESGSREYTATRTARQMVICSVHLCQKRLFFARCRLARVQRMLGFQNKPAKLKVFARIKVL